MKFEFTTATRIIFGAGSLREVGSVAPGMGRRALVVIGESAASGRRVEPLITALTTAGLNPATFSFWGEPTIEVVRLGARRARSEECDMIVGFGGGSILDAGKAIAVLLTNQGDPLDYVEVIGSGKPLTRPSAPYIAIPTTAGTGAEVTRNAVLGSPEQRIKVSMRSPFMLPSVALIDPELTYGLPAGLTATTGLDALTQLIEPYVSHRANPITDAVCREGIRRVARSLRQACECGEDRPARADMSLASLFSGLALANAGLGAVHGFAGPIGGMFDAPHGAVCAALLPRVMEMNLHALRERAAAAGGGRGGLPPFDSGRATSDTQRVATTNGVSQRYDEIATILTGDNRASAEEGVAWVRELCGSLKIPALSHYGIKPDDFCDLVDKASQASSMKANPVKLEPGEMREILQRAL